MAHAGSAHKYQGQTCVHPARVLYDVRTPPFCHGQSYVGLSRAQKSSQVVLLTLHEYGRCIPCLIYPQLAHWNSPLTNGRHSSAYPDTSSPDSTDNNSVESAFEPSELHVDDDACPRPENQSDIFNSIFEDTFVPSDKSSESDE